MGIQTLITDKQIIELADRHDALSFHYNPKNIVAFVRDVLTLVERNKPVRLDDLVRAIKVQESGKPLGDV